MTSQTGPVTTHVLHTLLHADGAVLPARPPPRNFLAGMIRQQNARDNVRQIPKDKEFPGQSNSAAGVWSITYLKNNVLKEMEEKGVLMKITRGKWDRMQNGPTSMIAKPEEPIVIGESTEVSTKKGKSAKSAAAKEADQHVWIIKEDYAALMAKKTAQHHVEPEARKVASV